MIKDLRHIPDGSRLECDVCIVGAGPAGIALAQEFVNTRLQVILLESGGFEIEPAEQVLNAAEVVGLPMTGHVHGRVRAFGGAARLWAGQCLPMDPIDFEKRDWVPFSGWPIRQDALEPYYRRAETFFG